MRLLLDVWLGVQWLLERVLQGNQRRSHALNRIDIKGYLIGWFVSISRVFHFDDHIHCFLLLFLLFACRSSNGESGEGSSQALQGIVTKPT